MCADKVDSDLHAMPITHVCRVSTLGVAISGASMVAGLLPSEMGSLSVVLVVLSTRLFGRNPGRLAAGFTSLGLVGALLILHHPAPGWSPVAHFAITIIAAWLCAELVSPRSRQPGAAAGLKADPFDRGVHLHDREAAKSCRHRTDDESYRHVVDFVPACVCVCSPTGELIFVNKVAIAALGRPFEEIIGNRWMEFIHPEDKDAARTQWQAGITERRPVSIVLRTLQHDGVYRWQHLLAEPVLADNGDVINWYLIGVEVDDTVKAQAALQASEKEARELLDRLPGRFATHTEHDFDYVNRAILEETGATLESLRNFGFLRFMHPDDQERVREGFLRCVQEKTTFDTTYRWASSDGVYRWRISRTVPYFNEDGSVYKWYGMNIDVDELYKSREVIREGEAQLNWLTETVPSLLWRVDAMGRIEYVNRRAEEYTGLRLDECATAAWYDLVHPEDAASAIGDFEESLRTGKAYDSVHRLRAADNSYRWFQSKATAMRDASGEIVKWYGLSTDVHDRQIAQVTLQKEELYLRRLVDAMPAMIWRAAPGGNINWWNRRMLAFIGRSEEDGRESKFFSIIPEDDRDRVRSRWMQAVCEGSSYEDTLQLTAADGNLHWYLVRAEPFRDEAGKITHWYGVCTDIDERKRAEDRLRHTQAALARATKIATVAELSASIAHELNQPLTSVMANAQACRRWLAASPPNLTEASASLKCLIQDARSADQTMQSIRALFKRESLQKRERNVEDMILEAVRLLREEANKCAAEFVFDLPGDLPSVFVDQIQIQQVLINLICNGIEATDSTGRRPRILITARPLDELSIQLEVIDNGSGITEGECIFDPFITTKTKGMGIGLAISRSIIEAHDGRLTASNNPGFGATFSLVLPAVANSVGLQCEC